MSCRHHSDHLSVWHKIWIECHTVHGRNPVPVDRSNIPLCTRFFTSQVVSQISSINSRWCFQRCLMFTPPIWFVGKRSNLTIWGFRKWWYPATIGFPTKNDRFGVFWGYHLLRKHPYDIFQMGRIHQLDRYSFQSSSESPDAIVKWRFLAVFCRKKWTFLWIWWGKDASKRIIKNPRYCNLATAQLVEFVGG